PQQGHGQDHARSDRSAGDQLRIHGGGDRQRLQQDAGAGARGHQREVRPVRTPAPQQLRRRPLTGSPPSRLCVWNSSVQSSNAGTQRRAEDGCVMEIERLLLRDRAIVAAGLAALSALAWLYIIRGAGMGMGAADMTVLALFPHRSALPDAPSMAPLSE